MEDFKQQNLIRAKLLSEQLMILKSDFRFVIIMAWSTKTISHMDGAELFLKKVNSSVILLSLMLSGKMENNMDSLEL